MTVVPEPKTAKTAVAWDDDAEEVILEHPLPLSQPQHANHGRLVICKKTANSITIEPMLVPTGDPRVGLDQRWTYVRTPDKDNASGRAIFRQGAAV